LASLRLGSHPIAAGAIHPGENLLAGLEGELFDLVTELVPAAATEVGFNLRGVPVVYDVKRQELLCQGKKAALKLVDGKIRLRFLVDRTSIDIFGNDGLLYMPMGVIVPPDNRSLELFAKGEGSRVARLEVFDLGSAW